MSTISTTVKINDAFSNLLDHLSGGLQEAQSGVSRLEEAISGGSSGGSIFKSVVGGTVVGEVISKGVELASTGVRSMIGELSEAQTSWTTFEGDMRQIGKSPAEVSKAKNKLQRFAEQTTYSAASVSSTHSQLATVGTKNATTLVKSFGGLAAAATSPV